MDALNGSMIDADTRILYIGSKQQFVTLVNWADYQWLINYKWSFKRSAHSYQNAIYARRALWLDGRAVTLYLHVAILERMGKQRPSYNHSVDHINGYTLDNRRNNLQWASRSEQELRKKRRARADAACKRWLDEQRKVSDSDTIFGEIPF